MSPINTSPLRKAVVCVPQLAAWGEPRSGRETPWLAEVGLCPGAKGCPAAEELDDTGTQL